MTNEELDARAHPWPAEGKWINFRFRRAVWAEVAPTYNQHGQDWSYVDLQRLILMRGIYPFLTWNFGMWFGREFKGYIGWKPISPKADPAFWWRNLAYVQKRIEEGALFTQLSIRGATAAFFLFANIAALISLPFLLR